MRLVITSSKGPVFGGGTDNYNSRLKMPPIEEGAVSSAKATKSSPLCLGIQLVDSLGTHALNFRRGNQGSYFSEFNEEHQLLAVRCTR
jgi:hypothetical protein